MTMTKTLKEQIDLELNRISVVGGPAFSVDTPAGQLECDMVGVDTIACSFERFELRTDKLASSTAEQLKKVCDSLSERLSYLLEPIALVETDSDSCVLQMRSKPPHKEESVTTYYELLVQGSGLRLQRYAKQIGTARKVIPANVTSEVFRRLANDFVGIVE